MKFLLMYGFQDYLIIAYSLFGIISAIGYGPQIWTLIKSTGRSMSTPISTWLLWSVEAFVTTLYAVFILQDMVTIAIVSVDLFAAITICGLTIYNRYYRFERAVVELAIERVKTI